MSCVWTPRLAKHSGKTATTFGFPTSRPSESVGVVSWPTRKRGTSTYWVRAISSQCIDGKSGETIWSIPLHEQFGMLSTYGGRTNFPVIHEDLVIISGIIINWGDRAKPNHRLIGMNKRTGEVVWFSGTRDLPYDTTYSAPSLVTIDGQRQLIMGAGDGSIWGFQPTHGQTAMELFHCRCAASLPRHWSWETGYSASHSEENVGDNNNVMGGVVGLEVSGTGDDTKVTELWKQLEVVSGYSEPVFVDDKLYWVDDRCKMWIFDAATGEAIVERKAFVR